MAADTAASGFEHMGLDPRLLRAVAELGWATPTAIQAQAIPLALEGRDLLARARTGSGKTGAYGLPLLHKLLSIKERAGKGPGCHVIAQFNRGLYDFIVATDEEGPVETPQRQARKGGTPGKGKGKAKDKGKAKAQDPEYGVARGIDFQNVSAVINFDVPPTVESYIHRVGRTARGDNPGTALTLALPEEHEGLTRIEDALAGENGQSMLQPYKFCMEEIESLRYRCRDAMRSVTKQAVKEARLREIRDELLNSEKLKVYFEDNPRDLHVLRHDKPLHPAIVKPHLRNVPDYLVPPSLRGIARPGPRKRKGPRVLRGPSAHRGKPAPRGTRNPLQSFKFSRRGAKGRAVPTP
ncbi:probable ATP-dependent RNA helicase DDX56 [Manacus vitellinus]|uniref:probable ATP-dependent RNA helicase DDX56 n=1 Tax=Manacus vitellinus TaxID=328815 RepID=UPI00115D7F72|nr:probable ATP-dependent RNA helicase DDX56 [Manacus vitellinus]